MGVVRSQESGIEGESLNFNGENMLKLYEYASSGNCYKIRLLLNQLGIAYQRVPTDILQGESRTPEFLAMNPVGKTPVLEIQPGQYLAESNAIIYYLADGTDFLPSDRWERAQVMQWLCFEQYSHEPNIATVRFWMAIAKVAEQKREAIAQKQELGYAFRLLCIASIVRFPKYIGFLCNVNPITFVCEFLDFVSRVLN